MLNPITIRQADTSNTKNEENKSQKSFAATVQFGAHGAKYPITITDPFSPAEEKQLEWYFEQWLKFPFTDGTVADKVAANIQSYGQAKRGRRRRLKQLFMSIITILAGRWGI